MLKAPVGVQGLWGQNVTLFNYRTYNAIRDIQKSRREAELHLDVKNDVNCVTTNTKKANSIHF